MKPKNCKKGIEALIFAKYSLSVETKLINIDRNNMATIRKLAKGLHQILWIFQAHYAQTSDLYSCFSSTLHSNYVSGLKTMHL